MADRTTDPNHSVGAGPVGAPARKYPAWLIPLIAVILLAIIVLLLLGRRSGGSDVSSSAPATTAPTTATPTSNPAATPAATGATTSAVGSRGSVTADGQSLLPLAGATKIGATGDLSAYTGRTAKATVVSAQSVPTNEGFWVGSSATDRVWVQLTGKCESPETVKKGDAMSFTGAVTANASGFAKAVGVSDPAGGKLLDTQGQHITVAQNGLTLTT